MAVVTVGSAALGGAASIAAAAYQASIGFTARHEATHAQQIGTTKQYITEFEDAYEKGEVSEEDWKEYLLLRNNARESEKAYEDSIYAYKDAPIFNLITKWKLKKHVRKRKRELQRSNRELRSHYDGWSSGASDASSISAEHGSPPRSRAKTGAHKGWISKWVKDVASSESESESEDMILQSDPRCLHVLKTQDIPWMLSFSRDSKRIAGVLRDQIKIWDMHATQMSAEPLVLSTAGVQCVAFSPDGNKIVSGSTDKTLSIWDSHTGRRTVGPLAGHSDWILCVAFSPDGQKVASGSVDNTIRIWDAQMGGIISGPLSGHNNWIRSVEFSPDSKSVISASHDDTIQVWDATMGGAIVGPLRNELSPEVIRAVFHPSGECLLSVSTDGSINSWNAKTGVPMLPPWNKIRPSPSYVSFFQHCSLVVSSSFDSHDIVITDVLTGESIADPLIGHTERIRGIAVSPDGMRVASSSRDKTIRLWDIDTCRRKYPVAEPLESARDL